FQRRRFFKYHVRIGAADAKRAHAGAARCATRFPPTKSVVHFERTFSEVNFRVWTLKMQAGRQLLVLQGEDRLDEPGHAGRGVEMAEIALHRANGAESFRR